jgi:hypothetical protein
MGWLSLSCIGERDDDTTALRRESAFIRNPQEYARLILLPPTPILSHCIIMSLYNEQELADHKRYSQI